ncbi:MAG: hypothetical protein V1754_04850 [Pseudomonadota bacterium]
MVRNLLAMGGVVSWLLAATPNSWAQSEDSSASGDENKREQAYAGVTLQGGDPPTLKVPPAGVQYVTWPGFRSTNEGTEVFLQMTGQVKFERKDTRTQVVLILENTETYLRNNLRSVITSHFPGPVNSFQLRPTKKGQIRLEISLREKAKPQVGFKTVGQYTYLVVSFPAR